MSVGHMVFVCLFCFFTSEHKDRKFAEVQWSEGEDSRKFSEVKTDQHGNPISTYSAVIQWRNGKKQRGGWPHYQGTVILDSGKLMLLWFKVKIVFST